MSKTTTQNGTAPICHDSEPPTPVAAIEHSSRVVPPPPPSSGRGSWRERANKARGECLAERLIDEQG